MTSVPKDPTIVVLREKLRAAIDLSAVVEVNYWDGDLCATGFRKGDRLIYISTFNHCKAPVVKYDYELERLDASGHTTSVMATGTDILFDTLVEVIRTGLQL